SPRIQDMFMPDIKKNLLKYTEDDDAELRLGAARGLGFLQSWEVAETLLWLLQREKDPYVRYTAKAALDNIELKHTIFVSYRRKDWPIVHMLADELERRIGAKIFFDRDVDEPDFAKSLMRNLQTARVFILIITEHTFASHRIHLEDDWIQKEIAEAL